MHRALRLVLFAALVALLPLRGMASVIADLCEPRHGNAMQASHECCAEGEAQQADAHHGDHHGQPAEGSCSHCAACSVGASVVSDPSPAVAFARPGATPIPFIDRRVLLVVPGRLDRPPLAL